MRKYQTLLPRAYAHEVRNLIERTTSNIRIDLHDEARRIADQSGMSHDSVFHDLTMTAVLASSSKKRSAGGGASV